MSVFHRWSGPTLLLFVSAASSMPIAASHRGEDARISIPTHREGAIAAAERRKSRRADLAEPRRREDLLAVDTQPSFALERPILIPVQFVSADRGRPAAPERYDAELAIDRVLGVPEPGVGSALLSTLALVLFTLVRRLKS